MKPQLQINRIEDFHEWAELQAESYTSAQSIGFYLDQIGILCKSFAFINTQVAVAKMQLHEAKKKAYETLMLSTGSIGIEIAPSLARDYINSKISECQYNFDICDRARSTCDTTIEALRSMLSALKEEMKTINYSSTYQP